ncbi:hypothetical protein LTR78_003487 [Recurvomyces mirabilis]|uniref:MJ1316 RNA cyclic group end recognition domain-containing protein n=1 Tax=Recurvomyces mirabilis TaxID=574656 RepID=A0AAE1C3E7_9PEZI|nr:hypothetical protein LTR78_003487 [Recurvomyces mirabilis]KAK5154479.1 hypothetical protein LTS14_006615 [Recurvomyces mirabilis]
MADNGSDGRKLYDAITEIIEGLADFLQAFYVDFPDCDREDDKPLRKPRRYIFPTGSFAIGLWRPGDDIRLIYMHDGAPKHFWDSIKELFDQDDYKPAMRGEEIWIPWQKLGFKGRIITNMKDSRLYTGRCHFPESFNLDMITPQPGVTPHMPPFEGEVSPHIRQYHQMIADVLSFLEILDRNKEEIDAYSGCLLSGYATVYAWATFMGLVSRELGPLNSNEIMSMVHSSFRGWHLSRLAGESDYEYLDAFFLLAHKLLPGLASGPPSPYGARAILQSLEYTRKACSNNEGKINMRWLQTTPFTGWTAFQSLAPHRFVITAECWDQKTRRKFFEEDLQVILHQTLRFIERCEPRIWPYPRKEGSCWSYIISTQTEMPQDHLEKMQNSIAAATHALSALLTLSKSDKDKADQMFRPRDMSGTTSTTVSLPPQATNSSGDEGVSEAYDSQDNASDSPGTKERKKRRNKNKNANRKKNKKFRNADAAISRLRHDPGLSGVAFEVGYEDRHEGLKWMALEDWGGKATEDENFIPQHRVRQLKRADDGVIVWDREERIDLLGG